MQSVVGEALATVAPEVLTADLATLEQRVQQGGRVILGGLIERVVTGHAQALLRPARGAACGGALKRRERPRRSWVWLTPLRLGNFSVAHSVSTKLTECVIQLSVN